MKAVVEPLEGNRVKLSVEVDEQEFEKAVDAAFGRFAREVRIPGFRPGKVPRRILQARIGVEAARQEALRESLPDFYARALREADVDPIAPPEIDIKQGQEQGPVAFEAVVEVRPQPNIAGYGGLRVVVPSPHVTDEEIDKGIDRLREQSGELQAVGRPAQRGDHVSIDVKAERAGEAVPELSVDDYLYEIGTATLVPELDDQLAGAKVGDILVFDTPVEDGPSVRFRVLVKDVKQKVLPEVTDEWAGEASEFETVEELRQDIRKRLEVIKRVQSTMAFRDEALKALVELVDDDAPEALVKEGMERAFEALNRRLEARKVSLDEHLEATGSTEEDLVAALRGEATYAVKADLALRALAAAEELEASDEEVEADVHRLAERLEVDPVQLRHQLEQQEALATVRSDVQKAKALEWLLEHVEVVDEAGQPIDRNDLTPAPGVAQHQSDAEHVGEEGQNPE